VAALVYEIAWAKMLALTFGSTTLSGAAVIAAFMGGMGLGARLYPALQSRIGRPLMLYAGLELAIAAVAALLTLTLYSLPVAFAQLAQHVPSESWVSILRFVSVLLLLLPVTLLMGATYPALCAIVIRDARGVDRHLGLIYGLNTIGAAIGALLAGLFLVERLGLHASTLLANGINVAVGGAALVLLALRGGGQDRLATPSKQQALIPTELPRRLIGLILLVSGFATLSYEIYWFRALRYLFGNATYALSIVLVIFLLGLGFGSLFLRRVVDRGAPERSLGWCQIVIAVLALGAMACHWLLLSQPELRDHVSIFSMALRSKPWWWRVLVDAGAATLMMLPATLFMGLSFPLASRLYLGDVRRLGSGVGGAYLLANVGGILGAIVGAVAFLPSLKIFGATKLSAALNLALGLLVLAWIRRRAPRALPAAVAVSAVFVAAAWLLPASPTLRGEDLRGGEPGRLIHFEEGDLATVQVLEDPENPSRRAMAIDGTKIGYSGGFRGTQVHRKQVMLAHLPMVMDTRIRDTLNVGFGSGLTLQTLADYPQVQSLDCVEINAAVVRASALFPESAVLEDPRVSLVVDDAVHYLLRTPRQYDLIVSDGKQDPWFSGNATMQCREFYRFARESLSEQGLLVQWIPMSVLYEDFRIILRTLAEEFPHVYVFYFPRWDVFTVAANQPLEGRPRLSDAAYRASAAHRDLAQYSINRPMALLSHAVASREQILQALGPGPVSTWDHMRLDFSPFRAPWQAWRDAKRDNLEFLLHAENVTASGDGDPFELAAFRRSSRLVREAFAAFYDGRFRDSRRLAALAVRSNPADLPARAAYQALIRESPKPPAESE
jgi:predicted membrane-bound spermidine synthase